MERTGGGDESWVALEGEGRRDRVVEDSMIYWEGRGLTNNYGKKKT